MVERRRGERRGRREGQGVAQRGVEEEGGARPRLQ